MVETAQSAGARAAAPVRPAGRRGATITLAIACAAVLLVLMDYNAPLVTVPELASALHAGVTAQTWTMNGMVLGLAASMLITGSLADDYGRRRVFVAGTVLFAVSLAAGAAVSSASLFVISRVAQGVGASAMLTASMGLVAHAYPAGPARIRATGLWGAMIGLGVAVGPLVAATVSTVWDWRVSYAIYAVLAVAIVVVTVRMVPESRADDRHRLDPAGLVTLAAGLTLLLAGLTEGRTGWLRPSVGLLFAGAAVALAVFVAIELRRREPMLDLRLFRRPDFVVATLGALITGLAVIGFMSYLPTVFQRSLGTSVLGGALPVTVWAGISFLISMQARRLPMAARRQIAVGLVISAVAYVVMFGAVEAGSMGRLYVAFAVSGVGSGLLNAALARLAVESVPAGRGSMGSGANQTARYLGSSAGVAITVVLAAGSTGTASPEALARGTDVALLVATALTVIGAVLALAIRPRAPRP